MLFRASSSLIKRPRFQRGASASEYAVALAFIVVAVATALSQFNIDDAYVGLTTLILSVLP